MSLHATVAAGCLIVAVGFALVAALGLIRLPDLYTRAHAASKSETLATVLALGAVALTLDAGFPTLKTILLLLFMFLTNPTAAHAITRAAWDQEIAPWHVDSQEGSP